MKTKTFAYTTLMAVAILAMAAFTAKAHAEITVGQAAPNFKATDIEGNEIDLTALKGTKVVLEWTNAECPFVKKHYATQNMQATQKKATEMGAVWITVNSSAPGKQGAVDAAGAKAVVAEQGAHPSNVILDPSGEIGKLYGAKTTPHMFIIDAEGKVAYAGAIDDNSSVNPDSVKDAKNYVLAALDDLSHGKPVATAQTQPYGCSVKY